MARSWRGGSSTPNSIFEAIREGYVKRLKAIQLNPRTLRYVRREDGQEVGLDEVCRLGEQDADFRRSIVTSTETLNTIVDASIRELYRLRKETRECRLKILIMSTVGKSSKPTLHGACARVMCIREKTRRRTRK